MSRADLKRIVLRGVFHGAGQQGLTPEITVGAVMTSHPFTVSTECSAQQLVKFFHEKQFRHFLVADDKRLVGVISDRDVIGFLGNSGAVEPGEIQGVTAAELMSTDLITVGPTTRLTEAVSRMVNAGINCLPVVDGSEVVGILTSTDIFLSLEQLLLAVLPTHEGVS
jgi:acetoin utilization protein AcuB